MGARFTVGWVTGASAFSAFVSRRSRSTHRRSRRRHADRCSRMRIGSHRVSSRMCGSQNGPTTDIFGIHRSKAFDRIHRPRSRNRAAVRREIGPIFAAVGWVICAPQNRHFRAPTRMSSAHSGQCICSRSAIARSAVRRSSRRIAEMMTPIGPRSNPRRQPMPARRDDLSSSAAMIAHMPMLRLNAPSHSISASRMSIRPNVSRRSRLR